MIFEGTTGYNRYYELISTSTHPNQILTLHTYIHCLHSQCRHAREQELLYIAWPQAQISIKNKTIYQK